MKKNLRKVLLLVLVLALALPMYACSSNSPEGVAKSFLKAIDNEDAGDFEDLLTEETLASFKIMEGFTDQSFEEILEEMLEEMNEEFIDDYGKSWYKDAKFKETENEDDEATVEVTIGDETEELNFIKEDGDWKINFGF